MQFNENQKRAITSEKNGVVLAGAGSGKTTVLAERFLYLVEEKQVNVDQILTLTFTRKAAAEMYERIYARLRKSDKEFTRKQLMNFDKAQISTIDSFCYQIIKNWSSHFGLPEDFLFGDTALLARECSLDFILAHQDSPILRDLIRIWGFERIWEDLFQSLGENFFTLAETEDLPALGMKQKAMLEKARIKHQNALADHCAALLDIPPRVKTIADNQHTLNTLPDLSTEETTALYSALKELKLKKPRGKAAEDTALMKELIDLIMEEKEILLKILFTLIHWKTIEDAFPLLMEFGLFFNREKRRQKMISFTDTARMAVITLKENIPLRNFYKNRFRYIMIDEFQDNNHLQKELLYLLAEKPHLHSPGIPLPGDLAEDKLFFVGDDKQSIYRFRGAEVGVFKRLEKELSRAGAISLNTNYRSAPGLIRFFNALFHRVMGGAEEDYEARFQDLEPRPGDQTVIPEIHFFHKPYDKDSREEDFTNDESEAFALASFIKKSVESGRFLIPTKEGGTRAALYDDFTILMRSTSNQIIYERMFRLLNIPYSSQSVRSLFLEAPVYDIYALLQCIVFPWDRSAYAALLRSPFFHLSDESVLHLLSTFDGRPCEEEPGLKGQEKEKWDAGCAFFKEVQAMADRGSLYKLVTFIWFRSGYRYHILKNKKLHNFLEFYDYLAALAEKMDREGQNLSGFLDFIRDNLGKYEKLDDLDIIKEKSSGVEMMTIHKSKGLEFEILVLGNTGNRGRNKEGARPYYLSREWGLTLNLGEENYFKAIGDRDNELQEQAELKRLLYVALTRARSHIILSGCHNRNNQNSDKVHLNMLMRNFAFPVPGETEDSPEGYRLSSHRIEDLTLREYRSHLSPEKEKTEEARPFYLDARKEKRRYLPRDFAVKELNGLFNELFPGTQEAVSFPLAPVEKLFTRDTQRMALGTLTHFLIEQNLLSPGAPVTVPPSLKAGFPEGEYPGVEAWARELASGFFQSSLGQKAAEAVVLRPEFPFLLRVDHQNRDFYIRGIMDLYFETPREAWVVDFKTDQLFHKEEYLFQMALYVLAAKEYSSKPVRTFLFPLRDKALELDSRQLEALVKKHWDRLMQEAARRSG